MRRTTRATVLFCCLALCTATVLGTGGAPVAAQVVQSPRSPSSQRVAAAILTVISGDVVMRDAKGAFGPVADGAVIHVGSTIRTGADARAVLTLFEGSTVELEPASDITIEDAAMRGGSTIVQLAQSLGRSWHVVTHLTTPDSRYEVRTPAATASVRGTAFEVAVIDGANGPSTTTTTTEGLVAVTGATAVSEVLVAADQTTTVRASEAPEPPLSAPEPRRVVTVSAVSEGSLVVDPLGRANGIKDGRVLAQTPGAQVRMENGTITITLPNVPAGIFATTVAASSGAVAPVFTTVADAGEAPVTIATMPDAVSGSASVELRETGGRPELRALTAEETRTLNDAKRARRASGSATAKPMPRAIATAQPALPTGVSPVKKVESPRITLSPRREPTATPAATRR